MVKPPDLDELARRYVDLWQEQLRAMAADPETMSSIGRMLSTMASAGAPAQMSPMSWLANMGMMPPGAATGGVSPFDAAFATGRGGSETGAAPAAAASDGGGDELRQLERRVAALEERLSALESGPAKRRGRAGGSARKRKS